MIRVTTFNINSCRRNPGIGYDIAGKIEILREINADIVGLNEVHRGTNHSGGRSQADDIADALDMKYRFFARTIYHDGGEYGIALLSRYPFEKCSVIPIPETEGCENRVVVHGLLDVDGEKLNVIISHFGLTNCEIVNAVNTVSDCLTDNDDRKIICMGDFNAEPNDNVVAPLYNKLHECCEGKDVCECLTFPADKPDRKIDYIFASHSVKFLSSAVYNKESSDHLSIYADIEL